MTWLVGNKLVTVTTSGCSQKVLKQGLCDKCWGMCNTRTDNRLLTTGKTLLFFTVLSFKSECLY